MEWSGRVFVTLVAPPARDLFRRIPRRNTRTTRNAEVEVLGQTTNQSHYQVRGMPWVDSSQGIHFVWFAYFVVTSERIFLASAAPSSESSEALTNDLWL